MKILAIETSCDETSCAIIETKKQKIKILSNIVSSQIKIHAPYGGVIPELAARNHLGNILPVCKLAFNKAKSKLNDINLIAITNGPGLLVSLLIGIETAKTLAYIFKKPIIPINHLEGHIYANFLGEKWPEFPTLVLIVSGGHTILLLMKNHGCYKILGETLDDAAGEAFDKVASLLNLPYPGGPIIAQIASWGNPCAFQFPRALLPQTFNFSFSGLKTAVLYEVKKLKKITPQITADITASFQEAVVDVLIKKISLAIEKYHPQSICLTGGVSANSLLRKRFKKLAQKKSLPFFIPPLQFCTDNAAMIACAGYFHFLRNKVVAWQEIKVNLYSFL